MGALQPRLGRLASRFGRENERAAAVLLLTLPGTAFIYQGDEIAMENGPGGDVPNDRLGRDICRHLMQWDGSHLGGFTTGTPWLPLTDPGERNVQDQRRDPSSVLSLFRDLIALRRELGDGFELADVAPGVVAYQRGSHFVAVNTTAEPQTVPAGRSVLATHDAGGARSLGAARRHIRQLRDARRMSPQSLHDLDRAGAGARRGVSAPLRGAHDPPRRQLAGCP